MSAVHIGFVCLFWGIYLENIGWGEKDILEEQVPGFLWKSGAFEVTKGKGMKSKWIWIWSQHDWPCGSIFCALAGACHWRTTPGCCLFKILDLSPGEGSCCCAVCTSPLRHGFVISALFLSYPSLCFLYTYSIGHNVLFNLLVLQRKLAHLCLASFSLKFIFSCVSSLYLKQILSYVT